jgi:hypothetical protein
MGSTIGTSISDAGSSEADSGTIDPGYTPAISAAGTFVGDLANSEFQSAVTGESLASTFNSHTVAITLLAIYQLNGYDETALPGGSQVTMAFYKTD